MKKKIKYYIALQGNMKPEEYIRLAKLIESLGFDRIYVYDDLFYYPSFPILSLIAQNTQHIQLGTCLVNGLYRHPAILASNYAFLDALSGGRAVLGMGRGAFFEKLKMKTGEKYTRNRYSDAVKQVTHFIQGVKKDFEGRMFQSTENAFLRVPLPENANLVTGTWNKKMAYLAGKFQHELQLAEVFTKDYFNELSIAYLKGHKAAENKVEPKISIGGMMCLANNKDLAYKKAKQVLSIYAPYLKSVLKRQGFNVGSNEFKDLVQYAKLGKIDSAAEVISDQMVDMLTLTGTSVDIANRINSVVGKTSIEGIMISPPYGIHDSIEENIKIIASELFPQIDNK